MSDSDEISVAVDNTVATDAIRADGDAYAAAITELAHTRHVLVIAADGFTGAVSHTTDPMALGAQDSIASAITTLTTLEESITMMVESMYAAARGYEASEAASESFWQFTWGTYFGTLGWTFSPFIVLATGLALVLPDAEDDDAPAEPVSMDEAGEPSAMQWLVNLLASSSVGVDQIAAIVAGTDDLMTGALVGPIGAFLLGQQGLGLTGTRTGAAMLLLFANQVGLLKEGPVETTRVKEEVITAPQGVVEHLDLIPGKGDEASQLRIVKYEVPGQEPRFEVYFAGTASFDFTSRQEPADMTANLFGMAGGSSAMQRAAMQAMEDAGVTASTPVSFIGYSQGGLMATLFASSGAYNTQSLLTIGAPAGEIPIPASVNAVVIGHDDDTVTALGGPRAGSTAVEIARTVFPNPLTMPSELKVPAHHYEYYQETGTMVDNARSGVVTSATGRLDAIAQGATRVTSYSYEATRTDAG